MKLDGDWYWKPDNEVGMSQGRRLFRNLKVWILLLAVIILTVVIGGLLYYKLLYDFIKYTGM